MLTNDELKRLAVLSRLRLDDAALDDMRAKVGSIIEYVDKLQEVDTEGVPEIANGVEQTDVFRDDVPEGCTAEDRARLVDAFPRRTGDLLEVQAVFARKE